MDDYKILVNESTSLVLAFWINSYLGLQNLIFVFVY